MVIGRLHKEVDEYAGRNAKAQASLLFTRVRSSKGRTGKRAAARRPGVPQLTRGKFLGHENKNSRNSGNISMPMA